MDNPLSVLKRYFGYAAFRPGQEKIITAILSGRDTLGIMPTGAGKSLCYQIPAILLPGCTLVISPLISLMQDQVRALNSHGIHAAYLNSSLTKNQLKKAYEYAARGAYKLIYLSPERLATSSFLTLCQKLPVSLICVDEAHCISKWGCDFRPSYRQIADFTDKLKKRPLVCAFTATATGEVRDDIIDGLRLKNPICLTTGFDRPNLFFAVEEPKNKFERLLELLHKYRGECGIVYCLTRRTVEMLTKRLIRLGIPAARYHAGMTPEERDQNLTLWLSDEAGVIIATNAFGMGIDKPDVRFVIHFNMPGDMEAYYQEAGRAGRDGLPSDCILLYRYQDIVINDYFINHTGNENIPDKKTYLVKKRQALHTMMRYTSRKTCLRAFILNYFDEYAPAFCGKCSVCIEPLKGKNKKCPQTEDPDLYRYLRALRLRIAKEKKMLPSDIFSDFVLHEMAVTVPVGWWDLICISKMNYIKLIRYGAEFLEELRIWKETH